jgi:pimeloyl-ACP methyl ester carboxylesterase
MTPHSGQDAGVPLIAVNGTELYYESRGTGAPLLVIGGLGLDVSEMGVLTGPLAARFRIIAADNRGAGRSAKPPGPLLDRADGRRRGGPDGPA